MQKLSHLTKIMKKYNFSPGPARLDPSVISKSKKGGKPLSRYQFDQN